MSDNEVVEPLSDKEQLYLANMLIALKGPVKFSCEYKNWRGEVATRNLEFKGFWFGSTEWHTNPGLLLTCVDLDTGKERDFSVKDFNMSTLKEI